MDKVNLSTITYLKLKYNNKVKASERPMIQGSQDAYNVFINLWDMEMIGHVESMKIMLLNKANRVLGIAEIANGGTGGCVVDVKVILQYAIQANATSIIIAHNHPSANLKPSDADIAITKKIRDAAKLMDITLLDHLIISPEEKYFSMSDECLF